MAFPPDVRRVIYTTNAMRVPVTGTSNNTVGFA